MLGGNDQLGGADMTNRAGEGARVGAIAGGATGGLVGLNRPRDDRVANGARVRSGGFAQALWNTKRAIALALLAVVLPSCNQLTGPEAGTTVSEVVEEPSELFGRVVTVSSEVEQAISPNAFKLENQQLMGGEGLLVVSAIPRKVPVAGQPTADSVFNENIFNEDILDDDIPLRVTGTVTKFVLADVKREFGLALEDKLFVEYEGKPVIIATAVTLMPNPGEIAEEPNEFLGKIVTVSSEVEKVIGPNAFTLDDKELIGGKELLVVGAIPAGGTINEGETVLVTGPVHKFVTAEIERDFDFDLQPELEVEYEGKAVVIARSTQIVE